MTDSEKLRILAKWFDRYDAGLKGMTLAGRSVQLDLLRIADELDRANGTDNS